MPNFATVADVELVLLRPITDADEIAAVDFALLVVSAAVRNYTKQLIDPAEGDVKTFVQVWGRILFLPELPVIEICSIVEDGTLLVAETDYVLGDFGMVYRRGRWWCRGLNKIVVEYDHGWDPIPDDIRGVTARAASRLFQAGLRAEDTGGVLGVASKSLGDFSVSYVADGSGADGTLGASGARLLILSEKDLLDNYRLKLK